MMALSFTGLYYFLAEYAIWRYFETNYKLKAEEIIKYHNRKKREKNNKIYIFQNEANGVNLQQHKLLTS